MGFFPPFFSCMETSRTEPVKQMQMLCCFLSFYSGLRAWNWSSLTLPSKRRKGTLWYFKNDAGKKSTSMDIWSGSLGLASLPEWPSRSRKHAGYGERRREAWGSDFIRGIWWKQKPETQRIHTDEKKHFRFDQELCDRSPREVRGCRSGMEMSLGTTPPWRGHLMSHGWAETHREPPWNAPKGMVFVFPELKGTVLWWGAEMWKQKGG